MHPNVARLSTPQECEQFAANVAKEHPELALQARRRAVELRARQVGAGSEAELHALEAVYAYEAALSARRGKTVRATRTWQMIGRHGVLGAVERAVNRKDDPSGYKALAAVGMEDLSFEAIVLRFRDLFSPGAVARAKVRLEKYRHS